MSPIKAIVKSREKTEAAKNILQLSEMPDIGDIARLGREYKFNDISASHAIEYGSVDDGVIELVAFTKDKGAVEVGFYYGREKQKNIIKISSQIGCPSRCNFCDLGNVDYKRNLSVDEMYEQVLLMLAVADERGVLHTFGEGKDRFKVNFSGSGEPMLNMDTPETVKRLTELGFSIKVSSVVPGTKKVYQNFNTLAKIAGNTEESVQLQISLISTSEEYRREAAGIKVAKFDEIRKLGELWRGYNPTRKQINLSLILAEDTPAEVKDVIKYFSPEDFRFRFRNCVPTSFGDKNNVSMISNERMEEVKSEFRGAGYYVGSEATPTKTELEHSLASNVTRRRLLEGDY